MGRTEKPLELRSTRRPPQQVPELKPCDPCRGELRRSAEDDLRGAGERADRDEPRSAHRRDRERQTCPHKAGAGGVGVVLMANYRKQNQI